MDDEEYRIDHPKPEYAIRIFTENNTEIGFFDGMHYYDTYGRMLSQVTGWEYI
jgi:hypothetical protein